MTRRLGYRIVNCVTLQILSAFAKTLRVGSVLIVGTLVILNSYQMLTCAGHVQVQRDESSTLGKLGILNCAKINHLINQSKKKTKNVSISLQARQLRNGMIALKEISP